MTDNNAQLPEGWTLEGTIRAAIIARKMARALATNTSEASLCDVWDDLFTWGGAQRMVVMVDETNHTTDGGYYDEDGVVDEQVDLTDQKFIAIVQGRD